MITTYFLHPVRHNGIPILFAGFRKVNTVARIFTRTRRTVLTDYIHLRHTMAEVLPKSDYPAEEHVNVKKVDKEEGEKKKRRDSTFQSLPPQSFCQKYVSQTIILTKKNFIIQRRFKEITMGQFFVGMFLIVILLIFSGVIINNYSQFTALFPFEKSTLIEPLQFKCPDCD